MKKLFVNIALFVLPLVTGYLLLELRLQKIPNSYNQKKKFFEARIDEVEVINIGSSHGLNGINPEFFTSSGFNLANITQTIYYDEALLEKYIDHMPKLKMVIIPVSYFSLHRRLENLAEDWRMYFYYYYWGIDVPGKSVFDINKYSLLTIYTPHVVMGIIRRGFDVDMAPKYSALGFEGRTETDGKGITDKTGIIRERYHAEGFNKKNVARGIADLDKLLKLLKEKHITPVLVTTPVYKTFYSHANPEILNTIQQVTDSMSRKYGCKYISYFTDSRFTIKDFADNDHLNYIGAEKFSKIMDSEIIRPILNGR